MKKLTAFLKYIFVVAAWVAAPCVWAQAVEPQPKLATKELTIGLHRIVAEVAADDATRQRGMMMRTAMQTNEGMLFIFDQPQVVCMWMRNTLLPLSVAFLDDQGKILNIEEMQAKTDDSHCAKRVAKYALEMNAHWFKKRHIVSGTMIKGVVNSVATGAGTR